MAESDIEKDRFLAEHADFRFREQVCYPNGGISRFYDNGTDMVVIDDGICSHEPKEPVFPYMLITERQNDYMHRFQGCFAFWDMRGKIWIHILPKMELSWKAVIYETQEIGASRPMLLRWKFISKRIFQVFME